MISVDAWQPADGFKLEPNALRAARELKLSLALTAGPGAGKTELLAQRADFLLRTGTCNYPKRILAISFKIDASKNLKERVQRRCGFDFASRFDSYTFHAFAKRIIDRFRPVLTGNDALNAGYTIGGTRVTFEQITFSELIPFAIQILQTSKVARNAIRQTYSDVFLDEFQDCTVQQYELVKIAFLGTPIRLTAVGDTKQKIMGWAGALDGIFKTFATEFSAVPLSMYRNFRSAPKLLRMQNDIIRVLDPLSVMPEEEIAGDGGEVFAWGFDDSHHETEYLANLITSWVRNEFVPLSEIAVLVSKQPDLYAEHLMAALRNKGIPFRNEQQMQDISVEPVARLIVDYLSCLYGQNQPKSWIRLMDQLVPFSDEDTRAFVLQDIDRQIRSQRKLLIISEQVAEPFAGWWGFAQEFLDEVGIETLVALSPDYESNDYLLDVTNKTKSHIEELLNLEENLPKALENFSIDQAVRILTIHKSKGLEFDTVIIMAVEEEIFFGDPESERCAFFVGVSRAKRRLVLTMAKQRERPSGWTKRWDVSRTAQREYFGYSAAFVDPR